jgi:acyl-CoA thioester hydrolase
LTCKFNKAAKYDDLVTINTYIREKPGIRIKFEYELFNEAGELLNTGSTQLVFVDIEKNRPCKPPQIFIDKMAPFFGE